MALAGKHQPRSQILYQNISKELTCIKKNLPPIEIHVMWLLQEKITH